MHISASADTEGAPTVSPRFVVQQGDEVLLVDLRDPSEAEGALGHVGGSAVTRSTSCFTSQAKPYSSNNRSSAVANGRPLAFAVNGESVPLAIGGHTPASVSYLIGDAVFVGDSMFMPDFGTARTDFPGGSAADLYDSIRRILSLPDETRLFMCHDYKAPGRDEFAWETSVAEQRAENIHINDKVSKDQFVEMREGRDSQLGMPKLILPSLQVNLCAGRLPEPEDNDIRYLKIPLDAV